MSVNPTSMAMEEVTVVTVVTVVTAMVTAVVSAMVTAVVSAMVTAVVTAMVTAAVVTAAVVTTLRLCRDISRGHHQAGYAYGGETIDCKQGPCCQQAGQKFACSTLFVPGHFISAWRV